MKKIITAIFFVFCVQILGQNYKGWTVDTLHIPFRGDTLKIDEISFNAITPYRLALANLDFLGLEYWKTLKKYNIKFVDYVQVQLERIFKDEEWLKKAQKTLEELKELKNASLHKK